MASKNGHGVKRKIKVTIRKLQGLPNAESLFVLMGMGKEKYATSMVKGAGHYTWNEEAQFENANETIVKLTLCEKDSKVGTVKINLEDLNGEDELTAWYPLEMKKTYSKIAHKVELQAKVKVIGAINAFESKSHSLTEVKPRSNSVDEGSVNTPTHITKGTPEKRRRRFSLSGLSKKPQPDYSKGLAVPDIVLEPTTEDDSPGALTGNTSPVGDILPPFSGDNDAPNIGQSKSASNSPMPQRGEKGGGHWKQMLVKTNPSDENGNGSTIGKKSIREKILRGAKNASVNLSEEDKRSLRLQLMSKNELITMILALERVKNEKESTINSLKSYIDQLLEKIVLKDPSILENMQGPHVVL
eukprot:Nk52_evm16s745 gene=Nk52_evmTU16s745